MPTSSRPWGSTCRINLDYDREKLQERVAKLDGGVAVIKVGAAGDEGKKVRVEDVLHALIRMSPGVATSAPVG